MDDLQDARETLAAAPDAIARSLGVVVAKPHPRASFLSLRDIARAAHAVTNAARGGVSHAVAYGGVQFSRVLADGSRQLIFSSYSAQNQHEVFCKRIDVKNFKQVNLPHVDSDLELSEIGELGLALEGVSLVEVGGATGARLRTYGKIVAISRTDLINDDSGAFGLLIAQTGTSAARKEARLVAAALEANPTLDDGAVVFDAAYQNVHAVAFDATALGAAMALLRKQTTVAGVRSDLAAKHLVVAADLEFKARSLLADFGFEIGVAVLSDLPDGRWYLLADPAAQPVVGLLKLQGQEAPLRVTEGRLQGSDGAAVRVTADLGAVLVGRIGIVRGGV